MSFNCKQTNDKILTCYGRHINFFFSGRTKQTTKQKNIFFYDNKWSEQHEKQEKLMKKFHVMFNAGQYIDQQKKDINN